MISIAVIFGVIATSILLFGTIARGAYRHLLNLRPNDKKVALDVGKMKSLLAPKVKTLLPWTSNEMSLLSLDQVDVVRKKRKMTLVQGTFTSIYHEPMVTYIYKRYKSKKEDAVIYARTSSRSFEFRVKNEEIGITINDKKVGVLKSNGVLYNTKNKMLGRINQGRNQLLSPVLLYNKKGDMKELGQVVNKNLADQVTPRALQLVSPEMTETEEAIFLGMALLDIIYKSVKN